MSKYILEAIKSCTNQTYNNYDVLIIDNNSDDETEEIVKPFLSEKIKYIKNLKNIGAINNFNLAIEKSNGNYIKFLEADDKLTHDCLNVLEKKIVANDYPEMIATGRFYMNNKSEIFNSFNVKKDISFTSDYSDYRSLIFGNEFGTPSDVAIKLNIFDKIDKFDICYDNYLNDWDLWIRIARIYKILIINDKLCYVRRHSEQMGFTGTFSFKDVIVNFKMINKLYRKSEYAYILISSKSIIYFLYREALKYKNSGFRMNNLFSFFKLLNIIYKNFNLFYIILIILLFPVNICLYFLIKFYYKIVQ